MKTPVPNKRFNAASAQRTLLLGIAALTTGITGYALSQREGLTAQSQPSQNQPGQNQPAETWMATAPAQSHAAQSSSVQSSSNQFNAAQASPQGYAFEHEWDDDDGEWHGAQGEHESGAQPQASPDAGALVADSLGASGVQMVPQSQRPSVGRTRGS